MPNKAIFILPVIDVSPRFRSVEVNKAKSPIGDLAILGTWYTSYTGALGAVTPLGVGWPWEGGC
jgi:hypothetical protein